MENHIKISVLMPSYNVKEYIEECINSVINQTLSEIEIICIDAGSTDGTFEILEKYSKKDSRIKLIQSDKKSYGYQMNLGLSFSNGEYISIIETDDYVDTSMLEKLYSLKENNVDIVKGNFYHLKNENGIKEVNIDKSKNNVPKNVFSIFDDANILYGHPSIWAAIYNRKFLIKNNIKFLEEKNGGWVDNPFYYETFCCAKSIKYTETPYYFYRESNPTSSSNNLTDLTLPMRRMLDNINILNKYNCKDEQVIKSVYTRIFWHINDVLLKTNYPNQKDKVNFFIEKIVHKMDTEIIYNHFHKKEIKIVEDFSNNNLIEEENTKISIIMPIYNAETELKKSVDSFLNQTLKNIELICIDDGSTDNSLKILNELETAHNSIRVYSQENQGSGKARNNAIQLAKGEYIGFLDADDFFIDNDALEKLYTVAIENDANMVSGNILHDVDTPGEFKPFRNMDYYTKNEIILPEEYGIPWSFYKNLIKKSFLEENNITFPDLLRGQDPVFLAEILIKLDKVYTVATDLYAYVYYDAINRCDTYRKLYDQILHYKIVMDYMYEPRFDQSREKFREAFFWFLNHLNEYGLNNIGHCVEDIFQEDIFLLNDIKNYLSFKKPGLKLSNINNPKISIIVPLFNNEESINKIFKSLQQQTFVDIEIIFIDRGSEDNTKNNVKRLIENEYKFKLISKNKISLEESLNIGYEEAISEWIFFFNIEHELSSEKAIENLFDYTLTHGSKDFYVKNNVLTYLNEYKLFRNNKYYHLTQNDMNEHLNRKYYDDPLISVIIPVYNAENFLYESITSLFNQTFKQFELVCVNDGSRDNSLKILNDFSKQDFRVKVIDQENGGCGAARNKALTFAKGKYIYFFDPDDYILPNTFEMLYKNAVINDTDLVMFKIARFRDNEPIDYSLPGFKFENVFKDVNFNYFTFSYKDVKKYVMNTSFAPWTKLYRKSFMDKYDDFKFPTNIAYDDAPFHIKSMLRASKISYIPEFFYHYRLSNPNSIINTSSNGMDIFRICDIVEDFLNNENYLEEFDKEFQLFKITQILNYLLTTNTEEYFQKAKQEFKKINLESNHIIDAYRLNRYNLVLSSEEYTQYIKGHYELELAKTNSLRRQDIKKIKEFKKFNNNLKVEKEKLKKDIEIISSENKNKEFKINELKQWGISLKVENEELKKNIEQISFENKNNDKKILELENIINTYKNSKSWKITKPLRDVGYKFK